MTRLSPEQDVDFGKVCPHRSAFWAVGADAGQSGRPPVGQAVSAEAVSAGERGWVDQHLVAAVTGELRRRQTCHRLLFRLAELLVYRDPHVHLTLSTHTHTDHITAQDGSCECFEAGSCLTSVSALLSAPRLSSHIGSFGLFM